MPENEKVLHLARTCTLLDLARRVVAAELAIEKMRGRGKTYPPLTMALYIDSLENALAAIADPTDSGPWGEVYRDAGGGYEGLQAIARGAIDG